MDWIQYTFTWYFYTLVLGLAFFPLVRRIVPKSLDIGYAYSRPFGLLLTTFVVYILGMTRIVPYTRLTIFAVLGVFIFVGYRKLLQKDLTTLLIRYSKQIPWIFVTELLFISCLFLWAFVRGQEPAIHGLEKFMDYGFMQSVNRSEYFPPKDMWYSAGPDINGVDHPKGFPINYYYFGHMSGALLTKLADVPNEIGYNLVLATILAIGFTLSFSIATHAIYTARIHLSTKQKPLRKMSGVRLAAYALLTALLLNFGGNLHTVYLLTRGYNNESPVPPWEIMTRSTIPGYTPRSLSGYFTYVDNTGTQRNHIDILEALQQRSAYWYPNATRFIPHTIHEFPSYSYVVADLHGHVFAIQFVLLTIGIALYYLYEWSRIGGLSIDIHSQEKQVEKSKKIKHNVEVSPMHNRQQYLYSVTPYIRYITQFWNTRTLFTLFLGGMTAVHFMTNAFDGPIYLLFGLGVLFLIHGFSVAMVVQSILLLLSFWIVVLPFKLFFEPFVSGVGVNCGWPLFSFLTGQKTETIWIFKFLAEKVNGVISCDLSAPYQLFILWGFFWFHMAALGWILWYKNTSIKVRSLHTRIDWAMMLLFILGTILLIAPEIVYVKDIYPTHFRANTMFKLGYQAYIWMTIASGYTFWRLIGIQKKESKVLVSISIIMIFFILIYSRFAIVSYYGRLDKTPQLDGIAWLKIQYPQDYEIVQYFNTRISGQPVILEAQGDSYTDHERISAYTGLPTVAGWWVHEWLWRGTADVVGKRIPDIEALYQTEDLQKTRELINKYHIEYIVVSDIERTRYGVNGKRVVEEKWASIGAQPVFRSTDGKGTVWRLP